jgi:hypothetical protein
MTAAVWIKGLVVARPDLYRAIYDWNLYPHRWIPADRLGSVFPAPILAALETSVEGRARLGAHFRQVHRLEETLWDLITPRRRLALLGSAALDRLARFAGAVSLAPRLARVIEREQRRELTARIGEEAYGYALRRASSLPGPGPLDPDAALGTPLPSAVLPCGWNILWDCVALEPEALRRRFLLKVPTGAGIRSPDGAAPTEPTRDRAWELVSTLAGELLSQEERQCFA